MKAYLKDAKATPIRINLSQAQKLPGGTLLKAFYRGYAGRDVADGYAIVTSLDKVFGIGSGKNACYISNPEYSFEQFEPGDALVLEQE